MSDILTALAWWSASRGDDIAFSTAQESVTYSTLARRVSGAASWMRDLSGPIGLLGASSIDWLVTDLAGWVSGQTIVPLPHFFSDTQLYHILADSGISTLIAGPDQIDRVLAPGMTAATLPKTESSEPFGPMTGERIVYTSGSTGRPKGVRLGAPQIRHTCSALMQAIKPSETDRHLSVLPYSLLLEAICGIYLPILSGGQCHMSPEIIAGHGNESAVRLGEAVEQLRPTTIVLVPQLLLGLVMIAQVGRTEVPDSLRFVAVGGAAVPTPLADQAWTLGIPVHEGYGLTECGSVVAVNIPGRRRTGTVGHPLPGYHLVLEADGEIIVCSKAVCSGYHGSFADMQPSGCWRTGDLGHIDQDGFLHILGRKDNLIVTQNGRNISPEWIETMLLADPRVARCIVISDGDGYLGTVIEASPLGDSWFRTAGAEKCAVLIRDLTSLAPAYAVPRKYLLLQPDDLAAAGLLTGNGRPLRRDIASHYRHRLVSLPCIKEIPDVVF